MYTARKADARGGGRAAAPSPPSPVDAFPPWDVAAAERELPGAHAIPAASAPLGRRARRLQRMLAYTGWRQDTGTAAESGAAAATRRGIRRARAAPSCNVLPPHHSPPRTTRTPTYTAGSGLPATGSAPVEKYEDALGLALPPASQPFLDAWKRPEELVQGAPSVPVVLLRGVAAGDGGAAAGTGGGGGVDKKGERQMGWNNRRILQRPHKHMLAARLWRSIFARMPLV